MCMYFNIWKSESRLFMFVFIYIYIYIYTLIRLSLLLISVSLPSLLFISIYPSLPLSVFLIYLSISIPLSHSLPLSLSPPPLSLSLSFRSVLSLSSLCPLHTGGTRPQRDRLCSYYRSRMCPYHAIARTAACHRFNQKIVDNMVTVCNFVTKLTYIISDMSQQHFVTKTQYSERN